MYLYVYAYSVYMLFFCFQLLQTVDKSHREIKAHQFLLRLYYLTKWISKYRVNTGNRTFLMISRYSSYFLLKIKINSLLSNACHYLPFAMICVTYEKLHRICGVHPPSMQSSSFFQKFGHLMGHHLTIDCIHFLYLITS